MFFNLLSAFTGFDNTAETKMRQAIDYEKDIMSFVDMEYEKDYKIYDVDLPECQGHIHTIEAGFNNKQVLVLVHGYAASAIFYFKVIKELKDHFHIYSIDLFGLGSSSRPRFDKFDFDDVVNFFVDPLEEWRRKLQLEDIVLMGHSMGGYLCAQYYHLKRPPIKMLYLLSPAGYTLKSDEELKADMLKIGKISNFFRWGFDMLKNRKLSPFNFSWIGSKKFMSRYFSGLRLKLTEEQATVFTDYFMFTTSKRLSGEKALAVLLHYARYSTRPISSFLSEMNKKKQLKVPVKILYGQTDWMDAAHSKVIDEHLALDLEFITIPDCDHQIIYQNPTGIAALLKEDQCRNFDKIMQDFIAKRKL